MKKNSRYDELNQKIRDCYKNGTEDKLILQTLYAQCNLEHSPLLKNVPDIREKTKFDNLTDKELVSKFSANPFNSYNQEDLNHLMQEVHNRYIGENKWDVTRMVLTKEKNPNERGVFGYCCYADDLLFINKDMIDEAKRIKDNSQPINAKTVGKYFLDTVWHETKHIIQYEDSIDFALNREQDKEKAFSAAAMLVMMSNFAVSDAQKDYSYNYQWRSMYRFHFCEHEANYAALKKSEANTEESLKENYDYQMYASDSAALALGFRPSTTDMKKNEESIKQRVLKIEDYLKSQIAYFDKGTSAGPIKNSMMKTLHDYMKVDANGNSEFRTRMTAEVGDMVETYVVNKRKMDEYDRKHGKKSTKMSSSLPVNDEEFMNLMR